jgi:hypothetical protein
MLIKTGFLALVVFVLVAGCASLSTYQKAQVLKEDESQFGIALTSTDAHLVNNEEEDPFFESVTYIVPEVYYRTSLGNKVDFGAKLFPLSAVIDGKYQFVEGEGFDMAADLGISYSKYSFDDKETTIFDIYPTILMTFNLSKKVDLTLAPKVITRFLSSDESRETVTMPGATLSLAIGPVMPEIGYYTSETVNFFTFGVAINIKSR